MKTYQTIENFSPTAKLLRSHFEDTFADPHSARSDRFIWDYWNVPGQYTTLRTPAYHFFPKKIYEQFHNQLVWWGRENLGCHDISPPWLSCYVDGCKQELHGDLPHGPWAFVFSLTPWNSRKFRGGETLLLKNEVLTYWQSFSKGGGLEREHLVDEVPAKFNRLTVFDPRIPHGVNEVRGVNDVMEGRLVIHGWFVQPRPFIQGPLRTTELQSAIDDLSNSLVTQFESSGGLNTSGVLAVRFQVEKSGTVGRVQVLSNSLRDLESHSRVSSTLTKWISRELKQVRFKAKAKGSSVTLPLIFEPA